jgi:hypothetical protein
MELLLAMAFAAHPTCAQSHIVVEISGDLTDNQRQNTHSYLSLTRAPASETLSEAVLIAFTINPAWKRQGS